MASAAAASHAWRCGFHLMPPTGWLNDPNGLCQFRGVYHVFHQYSPAWPAPDAPRGWGHFTSRDLVHWEHHGMAIAPDTAADATGAYSGSAVVVPGAADDGGDLLRLYYTGNVKEPGAHDYVTSGRQANEILVESEDGIALSPKRTLLRNEDYPAWCSCHVRDPKVWRQDGAWRMLLGARDRDDEGLVLLYRSADGIAWSLQGTVRPNEPFGYMWECPDRIALDGFEYLAFCPQGMERRLWSNGLRDQAGYIPLGEGERLIDVASVRPAHFERWDHGFDFYAPQSFADGAGRVLLIGWMGLPEAPFAHAPAGLDWCHCLTVPRVLSRTADGAIAQLPVPELEALRGAACELAAPGRLELPTHRADLLIDGIERAFALTLDGALRISFEDGVLQVAFADGDAGERSVGAGRTVRRCALGHLDRLRVLVDSSAVEVYANDGAAVFSTRWFPVAPVLTIAVESCASHAVAYPMGDGMAGTY